MAFTLALKLEKGLPRGVGFWEVFAWYELLSSKLFGGGGWLGDYKGKVKNRLVMNYLLVILLSWTFCAFSARFSDMDLFLKFVFVGIWR